MARSADISWDTERNVISLPLYALCRTALLTAFGPSQNFHHTESKSCVFVGGGFLFMFVLLCFVSFLQVNNVEFFIRSNLRHGISTTMKYAIEGENTFS